MFYTVYKITNLVNNKIYIGAHKTTDLSDDYMGSGVLLSKAKEKYGIENFKKEYIKIFDNSEDMFSMESQLVNEEFVSRNDTYNIKQGGLGGFDYLNLSGKNYLHDNRENSLKNLELGNKVFLEKLKDSGFKKEWVNKISSKMKENFENGMMNGFSNKKHSEETKEKLRGHTRQNGSKNSQYGTMWIHSLTEKVSKKINKDDFLIWENKGWIKGRKMNF